jgi:Cu/Ag efflux protein CusF
VKLNNLYSVLLALLVLIAIPAAAEEDENVMMPMDGRAPTLIYQGQGMVNGVDAKSSKVSLSHGPIVILGLKARITNFEVVDRSLLAHLKKGQKVVFSLVEAGKGQYAISEIAAVK